VRYSEILVENCRY